MERSLQKQQKAQSAGANQSSSVSAGTGSSFDLALLEVENDRLRDAAEALLRRQQTLEELAVMHKLVEIQGGRLIWNTSMLSKEQADASNN